MLKRKIQWEIAIIQDRVFNKITRKHSSIINLVLNRTMQLLLIIWVFAIILEKELKRINYWLLSILRRVLNLEIQLLLTTYMKRKRKRRRKNKKKKLIIRIIIIWNIIIKILPTVKVLYNSKEKMVSNLKLKRFCLISFFKEVFSNILSIFK